MPDRQLDLFESNDEASRDTRLLMRIVHTLGHLEAKFEGMESRLNQSSYERKEIMNDLKEVKQDLSTLNRDLPNLQMRMGHMEPQVIANTKLRQNIYAGLAVIAALGSAVGALIGWAKGWFSFTGFKQGN